MVSTQVLQLYVFRHILSRACAARTDLSLYVLLHNFYFAIFEVMNSFTGLQSCAEGKGGY
jgi:hypothetical protein